MYSFMIFAAMFLTAMLAATAAVVFAHAAVQARARIMGAEVEESTDGQLTLLKEEAESVSTIRVWRILLERIIHVDTLKRQIAEADMNWTVGRMVLMMMMLAMLTASVLGSVEWIPGVMTLAAALGTGYLPYGYMRFKHARRLTRFSAQFPEALDSLARAMKAGYPLASAMELLAMEQPEPLATEMRRTRDQWKLGTSWEDSLDALADRIPVTEVRMFAAAVKLQNRVGGKLNDVLTRMAETMREGSALEGEIRSITAHGRMTGGVLTALPVGISVVMFVVNPEYMANLFQQPVGRALVMAAIVANIAAHVVIKKMSRIRM
ncbi:MAG: type II secretion system F family protein [Bryobacteraceae bacterium]|nr:type II secretion system F family protein [Bryobacteraceae bacterium]